MKNLILIYKKIPVDYWIVGLIIICLIYFYFGKRIFRFIRKKRKQRKYRKSVLFDIDRFSGTQFEEYLAIFFNKQGYKTENIGKSGDYGADLLLHKAGISVAVQAKCYKNPVGVKAVQEIISAREYYKTQKAIVITNSHFTKNAINMAEKCNVILYDRDFIRKNL